MAKLDLYSMDSAEKAAVFNAIASNTGMTPFAAEKDWWVSRTLDIIFQMPIATSLVFKGGTSLSKAWKLINRFSEDIDLAIDRKYFPAFQGNLSNRDITKLRQEAGKYTTGAFFTELQEAFKQRGFHDLQFIAMESEESDKDPRILEIHYPNIIPGPTRYMLPRVLIEISCRSLREPFTPQQFGALVDEYYFDSEFAEPLFTVPTVNPERTFLEKLFLLHEEFHRPLEKVRVDRLSRHLYDIYQLTNAGIAERAINDKELYQTIVSHRHKFTRLGGVDYNSHDPKKINPLPIKSKMAEWKADYAKMMEEMIYDENKPSFNDLIKNLEELRTRLQSVAWSFELTFPIPPDK
jgi:predicted nucleotidyltransferase component of viral defense system